MSLKELLDRLRYVFEDTEEIAGWFNQRTYEEKELRTHLFGMRDTMLIAADRLETLSSRTQSLENAMLAIMAVVVLPYDERSHEDVRLIATSVLSKEGGDDE